MKAQWMIGAVAAVAVIAGVNKVQACAGCRARAEAAPPAAAAEEAVEVKVQTLCPVMDRAINKEMFVDHEGARIYVCCRGCVRRVKADPAAALAKLKEQGVEVAKAEVATDDAAEKPAEAPASCH